MSGLRVKFGRKWMLSGWREVPIFVRETNSVRALVPLAYTSSRFAYGDQAHTTRT